ncbi:MAG: malto-oligosyltrehalose synthase [Oleiphilaceae bacterium]|nr:malto-oligosyltrehalose synthase [Oleiphilaceae bacterium]
MKAIPTATYRLQLNSRFTFADASKLVPYLDALGISHCYCSPYLKARPGSQHGYDIVDHCELNPEIGSQEALDTFVATLKQHDMGHILDLVPNHMGIMGNDNHWWLDVLENGLASRFSQFFDIDWAKARGGMHNKVLLPVLGDHYGNVLDDEQLELVFDPESGSFSVYYYEHCFPIDPQHYPFILKERMENLPVHLVGENAVLVEFQSLTTAFENLPSRDSRQDEKLIARNRDKELLKQRLCELHKVNQGIAASIQQVVKDINQSQALNGDFTSPMHELLERQAYRLAHWRVASDEINYRRFFDINDLACLRQEEPAVFEETHKLALNLLHQDKVQGLRIDHPDGLYNPAEYFRRLQEPHPFYLIAEKILSAGESLRDGWPVHGTTGYEFAAQCTGLFIEPGAANYMQGIYEAFVGHKMVIEDIRYQSKKLIVHTSLASEMAVLATQLSRISDADPHTRDYTLNGLRQALTEIVACFPVYRTYISDKGIAKEDELNIDQAVAHAIRRSQAADITAFDFIREVLLLRFAEGKSKTLSQQILRFTMRFQQYTAPVMAKGFEDTALYIYHRLVALNEVGSEPGLFGIGVNDFHEANARRQAHWPHSMTDTSTHDTKRSADARARIGVLSEIPARWNQKVNDWAAMNAVHKTAQNNKTWPEPNTEYLFYQTLVGVWPIEPVASLDLEDFRARIRDYMLKAVKEGKQHTSWINSNAGYEDSLARFVDGVLSRDNAGFLEDFSHFQEQINNAGMITSLAQTLLKLTAPGVPDIYQGDELWNLNLVDPDNRRPVDFDCRTALLKNIQEQFNSDESRPRLISALSDTLSDGRIKLFLTWLCLSLRRQDPALFQSGAYIPLQVTGPHSDNVCAFARKQGDRVAIVVVPRLLGRFADLTTWRPGIRPGDFDWAGTSVEIPPSLCVEPGRNLFTRRRVDLADNASATGVTVKQLLADFPVALLLSGELASQDSD